VLARIAGSSDFSDEILGAGREAVLGRATLPAPMVRKSRARKAAPAVAR
jgi:TetR/AcrR family transcriptional regulator, transcriptional repressor for nem operon